MLPIKRRQHPCYFKPNSSWQRARFYRSGDMLKPGSTSAQTAQIVALLSRIRKAVHFEGTLSRDAHSSVRAEESRDVVPMLCHFACRAEPRTVGVDLLSKPLERIRNLECLKIAGCSGMLARTVRARAPTAPGSRAALAGSLPQFWARAESCRSIPTSRGTIMFALKSEPRPADPGGRLACHRDSLISFSPNCKKQIQFSSRALDAAFG